MTALLASSCRSRLDRFEPEQQRYLHAAAGQGLVPPLGDERTTLRALPAVPSRVPKGLRIVYRDASEAEHIGFVLSLPELDSLGIAARVVHEAPPEIVVQLLAPLFERSLQRAADALGCELKVHATRIADAAALRPLPWRFVAEAVPRIGALRLAISTPLLEACLRTPLLPRSRTALQRIVIGWDLQLAPWQLPREALQGIEPGDLVRVPVQAAEGGRFAALLVPHRAGLCGDARAWRAFNVEAAVDRGGWIRLYLPSTNPATHTMDESTPLEALTVPVMLQLPLVAMSLGDIEAARPGTLVDTGVRLEDIEVGLCSAGQHFASGRLVLIGENLGVEVTRLVGSTR
jgi:flagellar motor switch/type III secretory pathway protein FliN